MPSYQEWVRKIDINIDYYSAFIKSWIAFNSWYRSEYTERTDRGIIEKLKTENNRFKGYIETMLDENNNSDEAIIFKKNLKDLQAALVNAAIVTQERDGINQQISFSEIAINNPKRVAEGDYAPRSGSSHYTFRKQGCMPITIPKHEPIKKVYVEMVRQIVESEAKNDEDAE